MKQLFGIYRLGQITVHPNLESPFLILDYGQDNDGDIHGGRVVLEHGSYIKTIDLGHHHIEDDQVRHLLGGDGQAFEQPVRDFVGSLRRLWEILGTIHLIDDTANVDVASLKEGYLIQ